MRSEPSCSCLRGAPRAARRNSRGCRAAPAPRARPQSRLAQPASAQLRRQHLQIRPGQRRCRGEPGLDGLRFHPRRGGRGAPLLHRPAPNVRRHRSARHRPAVPSLAYDGPHSRGSRRLVPEAELSQANGRWRRMASAALQDVAASPSPSAGGRTNFPVFSTFGR